MPKAASRWRYVRKALYTWSPSVLGAAMFLSTLTGAQLVLVYIASTELHDHTTLLLRHAEEVAQASIDGLTRATETGKLPCSEADLAELRLIAFQARYIKDVGRIIEGKVTCTAAWGLLASPVVLPQPSNTVEGYSLWRRVRAPVDGRVVVDMAARSGVLVTTSPDAFSRVGETGAAIESVLTTRDYGYVFQALGGGENSKYPQLEGIGEGSLQQHLCSSQLDICAWAKRSTPTLLELPGWIIVGVLLLALTGGAGLSALLKALQARRCSLERLVRDAIRHGDIELVYQPLRRLSDGHMVGAEALARWRTDRGADIPPSVFVPMAESQGLGQHLARLVIGRALAEMSVRLRDGGEFYISINLSAQDVLSEEVRDYLVSSAENLDIQFERVVLELTERTTASHTDLAHALTKLTGQGFRIYLDDFGTGYSNFSYLADLPLAGLKMDRQFTCALGTSSPASRAAEAICTMASVLGLTLTAEGVESEEQAKLVRCLAPAAIGQGWLLGRPCSADQLLRLEEKQHEPSCLCFTEVELG